MVVYLSKFLPRLSEVMAPLSELAGLGKDWEWTPLHDAAFRQVKELCSSAEVIKPIDYESKDQIYLITDASQVGTGAWIGQGPNRDLIKPAGFSSKKFNPAQQRYSTFDKEFLAMAQGLVSFQSQLQGSRFIILTDHKPLVTVHMNPNLTDKQER